MSPCLLAYLVMGTLMHLLGLDHAASVEAGQSEKRMLSSASVTYIFSVQMSQMFPPSTSNSTLIAAHCLLIWSQPVKTSYCYLIQLHSWKVKENKGSLSVYLQVTISQVLHLSQHVTSKIHQRSNSLQTLWSHSALYRHASHFDVNSCQCILSSN